MKNEKVLEMLTGKTEPSATKASEQVRRGMFIMELVIPSLTGAEDRRVKVGEAWVNKHQELIVHAIPVGDDVLADMVTLQEWWLQGRA